MAARQVQLPELQAASLTGKLPQSSIRDLRASHAKQCSQFRGAAAILRPEQPPKSLVRQV
eukprot:CAMPEP_0178460142 /NCGR_PEP_ID=MMETSP0689_2-20121128/48524_1 /TAXON_ID=160604 /ORGANISM="Amphidinium massartii, Strain CS-259" /LENGTH=59 /DNA_ID=CAMNT_0020086703 /DNA_START=232 /DNA_END=407 /DNA_ORIENTATION=+